ncbi:hypothetical protein FRC18_000813 [Serendipita sp. 400]|nr:hypothetical protein FRC18_000813 [Serendipita sp. 400]
MADPTPSSSVTAPPPTIAQPDHFYCNAELHPNTAQNLTPEEDPVAARGIPVFKPTWQEFSDFEKYMEAIQPWGIRSGIVKVIPPVEWRNGLPDMRPFLEDIKIRHPIEQNMLGISGIFRQQNIEKRRVYSLREWFEVGMSQDFRSPGREEVYRDRSKTQIRKGRASKGMEDSRKVSEIPLPHNQLIEEHKSPIQEVKSSKTAGGLEVGPDHHSPLSAPTHPAAVREDIDIEGGEMDDEKGQPPVDTNLPDLNAEAARLAKEQKALFAKERKAARAALRSDLDSSFISTFDPTNSWVPPGSSAEDFSSPEFAAAIERAYWRSCGVGKPAMYGADLPGSLFCDISRPEQPGKLYRGIKGMEGPIPWDVSRLPSALTRLLPRGMKLPGVNTPYLYFGMWRATFAWHVEDMDLYSINYIHWGAPKHWYAVPQARAKALEGVMRQMFPSDRNGCPQFLRHKSYLASPTALKNASIKPNTLVQSAGEFVVTYPRGYHAGFNMGLNCAESVNFALESWLELGRKAAFCRCVSDSVRIDVDALLAEKTRIAAEEEAGLRRPTVEPRLAKVHPAPPPQALGAPSHPPKPRKRKISETSASPIKANPVTIKRAKREVSADILPCCLCVSPATEGLLPVNDPPFAIMGVATPVTKEGAVRWMAHETCASIIPETWVDEVDGQKKVFGVDTIAKDRWLLVSAHI